MILDVLPDSFVKVIAINLRNFQQRYLNYKYTGSISFTPTYLLKMLHITSTFSSERESSPSSKSFSIQICIQIHNLMILYQ